MFPFKFCYYSSTFHKLSSLNLPCICVHKSICCLRLVVFDWFWCIYTSLKYFNFKRKKQQIFAFLFFTKLSKSMNIMHIKKFGLIFAYNFLQSECGIRTKSNNSNSLILKVWQERSQHKTLVVKFTNIFITGFPQFLCAKK